jgi:hypothetical protein
MGSIRTFNPVKLFVGVLVSDPGLIPSIRERLTALFGTIDHESPVIPFDFTDYYSPEMGDAIDRLFFSFASLIDADELAEVKRQTNTLEEEFSTEQTASQPVKRPVNLDPGYIENAKVILASTKNFYHRIYLGRGIFAEVTMHFRNNTFQFFPWTYPDYQSKEYQEFFLRIRHIYRSQLKTMCILNREEPK